MSQAGTTRELLTFLKVRRKWRLLPIILVMLLVGMLLVPAQRRWGSPNGRRTESARGVPARLTVAEGRKFGLVVGGAFLVLGAILAWRAHGTAASIVLVLGSALVAGLARRRGVTQAIG
jgi:hypothetical protein